MASSIWKRLSAGARTSGVSASTNARASSCSRSQSCASARSQASRTVVAEIAECSSPMSRISEIDVERNQSRMASVCVRGWLTTKVPPLRPLRVSTTPRSRSSPKASRRVAPPTPNISESAASGGRRSPTLSSPSPMALVILSTIASALSISGRDRYIWDWNEDGEAKSLRSGKWDTGWVVNTSQVRTAPSGLILLYRVYAINPSKLRLSGTSHPTPLGAPILKCSQNRQKTVLPLPVPFGSMDINQKASFGCYRPTTEQKGKTS